MTVIALSISGCSNNILNVGAPETNDNQCFNALYKNYSERITTNNPNYRMLKSPEGVKLCTVNRIKDSVNAYLLLDTKTQRYWHGTSVNGLMYSYNKWQAKEEKKACAANPSCVADKKRKEEEHQKALAQSEKNWAERQKNKMKQCLPYAKDLSDKAPSLSNPEIVNAFGNGIYLSCQVKYDQKTLGGTYLRLISLTINTSTGAYEY